MQGRVTWVVRCMEGVMDKTGRSVKGWQVDLWWGGLWQGR